MEKYNGSHWWEPDVDERTMAYYQLKEEILLVTSFSRFHGAVGKLLGRPVWAHELGSLGRSELRREAERAWKGRNHG